MRTLLDDQFAPITTSIGFLRVGIDEAVAALTSWAYTLGHAPAVEPVGGLRAGLEALQPLVGGARPRELLVSVGRTWTAYFDCGLRGTDAVSTIGYLTRVLNTAGLAVVSAPHTIGAPGYRQGQYGAVHFELFGPRQREFLNYVRVIAVTHDGSRWVFTATGEVQPYEETDRYRARRVRDRFTSGMLERYCQALGIEVFDPEAYGPRAVLVRSNVTMPKEKVEMSVAEAQRWLDIHPGEAHALPG